MYVYRIHNTWYILHNIEYRKLYNYTFYILSARMMRPNVEACNDNPNHGLKAEVSELKNSISHLKAQLATSGQFLINDPDFFHLGSSPVGDDDLWCHLIE